MSGSIKPTLRFTRDPAFLYARARMHWREERYGEALQLLHLALEIGCVFSIDTDAHAPGQLDFLGYGAQRALDADVPVDRIVNSWPVDRLLAWAAA